EEHALLHGRERIEVRDLAVGPEQPIQRGLVELCQREIRGRVATGLGRLAVADQVLERREVALRQPLDRRTRMDLGAVDPAQVQLLGANEPDQLQQMAALALSALRRATALHRRYEQLTRAQHLVELPEVVEAQ